MYFNTYQQVISGVSASATFTTDVKILNFGYVGFQIVWTSHNSAGATFKLQSSIDGTNFNDIASSTVTLVSGSSSQVYVLKQRTEQVIRGAYDPGSNTAGTIDVWRSLKGHV